MNFLAVCLGGALGCGARYLVSLGAAALFHTGFPIATFAVNLVGSFLLAFFSGLGISSPTLRLMLTTGAMGGFTTYSTFNLETLKLFQSGAWLTASLNIVVTLLSCLFAGLLGLWLGAKMSR